MWLLTLEAGVIKVVAEEDHTEEAEDTDSLGEQPEFTQMGPPKAPVPNTDSMESRHTFAESHCHAPGCHMSQERHKTHKRLKNQKKNMKQ